MQESDSDSFPHSLLFGPARLVFKHILQKKTHQSESRLLLNCSPIKLPIYYSIWVEFKITSRQLEFKACSEFVFVPDELPYVPYVPETSI